MLSFKLSGAKNVEQNFGRLAAGTWPSIAVAINEEAEHILNESQEKYVPVVSGDLKDSGFVRPAGRSHRDVRAVIGYDSPYAAVTHENPRAGKTRGMSPSGKPYTEWSSVGTWKFLEKPMARRAKVLQRVVGQKITIAWAQLLRR